MSFAKIGAAEMELGLDDGGKAGKHNSVSLCRYLEYLRQGIQFSSERYHLTELVFEYLGGDNYKNVY